MNYALATPNVYQAISGASRAALVTAIINVLTSVHWVVTSAITGGSQLLGVSPQGLKVYCQVWDNGTSISLKLLSFFGTIVGHEHRLAFDPSFRWHIAAHPCGFAIGRTDKSSDPAGTAVMAGIPRIPDDCGLSSAGIFEVWFSFGDWYGNVFAATGSPRTNLDIANGTPQNQTGCFNGTLYPLTATSADWSQPQILRRSSGDLDNVAGSSSHGTWFNGKDVLYSAMVGWGDLVGGSIVTRGQVYNAAVRSSPATRDMVDHWDTMDWVAYTDNYFWGTLWLLKSDAPSGGEGAVVNVAY